VSFAYQRCRRKLGTSVTGVAFIAPMVLHGGMTIRITHNAKGTGYLAPEDAWHLAEGDNVPGKLWFKMKKGSDGRWFCSDIEIDGDRPLTTTELRRIPLTRLVEQYLRTSFGPLEQGGPPDPNIEIRPGVKSREWYDGPADGPSRTGAELLDSYVINPALSSSPDHVPKRGGRGPSDAELLQFVEAYRYAQVADPRRPVAAAIEYMSRGRSHPWISRTTAQTYLRLAGELKPLEGQNDD
jgi:hypothetical protein